MADCNIVIGGEAGRGLVTIGGLISKSLVRSGYSIVVTQSYESRIRGGHNSFDIRVSNGKIFAPQEKIDLLIALDAKTVELHSKDLNPKGLVLAESGHNLNNRCLKVPYKEITGDLTVNMAALGIVSSLLGLDESLVEQLTNEAFHKKDSKTVRDNINALKAGFAWANKQTPDFEKLPPVANPAERLTMNGNDAVALGALAAGLKFYSFYPMTPSTGISQALASHAGRMDLVVRQAEDEIAAINMAIGASFAGAPSMVATSGGGFALMVEGVSLAAMTETPIVVVVGQRPSPATGLPTRTEQADLDFILHSGHGEFPRAILAPGNVEQCFHLTRKAFELAWGHQGPVFILTDQFLADSYRAVSPFSADYFSSIPMPSVSEEFSSPYSRYALTEDGISPFLFPGATTHLVVADSDEHAPDGHPTEDLGIRKQMVEKRLKKYLWLNDRVQPPEFIGDKNPETLLICWGSTMGSAIEAVSNLQEHGKPAAVLHFSQIWPLIPDHFVGYLKNARDVICVEGNAFGQLARLIRREAGFEIEKRILRYDGLPITPEYIIGEITNGHL